MGVVFRHAEQSHKKIRDSGRKRTIDGKDNKYNDKLEIGCNSPALLKLIHAKLI